MQEEEQEDKEVREEEGEGGEHASGIDNWKRFPGVSQLKVGGHLSYIILLLL